MSAYATKYHALCIAALGTAIPAAYAQAPQPNESNSYTVEYTGRLFGYFRVPDVQSFSPEKCPDGLRDDDKSPEAAAFGKVSQNVRHASPGTTVLVAVGDNFAPFLLSRKMLRTKEEAESESKGPNAGLRLVDKEDYEWDQSRWVPVMNPAKLPEDYLKGKGTIPTDNVACFLMAMQFDAIVPGEHDFHFGPERLREIARFLHQDNNHPRMLASNLYMKAKYVDPYNPQGPAAADAVGAKGPQGAHPNPPTAPKVVLPKTVLPWMRAITIRNAHKPRAEARDVTDVCVFPVDPDEKVVPKKSADDCRKADLHFSIEKNPRRKEADAKDEKVLDLEYWLAPGTPPLDPGAYRAYMVTRAATGTDGAQADSQPFTVQLPFLEYPATGEDLAKLKPWVIKGDTGKQRVAIFGVVSATILDQVGSRNSTWLYQSDSKVDNRREVEVMAADAAEALKQVFQYCESDTDCRSARKVLLAQMPQQEAYELAPHIAFPHGAKRIDLIVAAADPDRATGDRELTRDLPPRKEGADPARAAAAPVVVLPGPHFGSNTPYELQVQISAATVMPSYDDGKKQYIRNKVYRADPSKLLAVNPFPGELNFLKGDDTLVARSGIANTTQQEARAGIEQLALRAMRETCHADIAMLQHRDVFLPEGDLENDFLNKHVNEEGLKQLLSAILWKGDFVVCQNLTGDTINSVLQLSKQLEDDETNGLATELTMGMSLAILGADAGAAQDTDRVIDAQVLDPKRLYSVALTDFLATGAAGYSMLNGAEPPPATLWSKARLRPLSVVAASTILNQRRPDRDAFSLGKEALDRADLSKALPPAAAATFRPAKPNQPGFRDWAKHLFIIDPMAHICPDDALCPEGTAQQKSVLWIDLYKADVSYSLFLHNGSEESIGQRFPGVTSTTLSTPESASKAADYIFRVEHDSTHFLEYGQSSLNYGYRVQRGTTNNNEAYQPSQTADYYYLEGGLGIRFRPVQASPAGWKAILAAGVQTQPGRPFTQFSLSAFGLAPASAGGSSSSTPPTVAPRSIYDLQHFGFRYDFIYPKPKSPNQSAGGVGGSTAGGASASNSSGGKKGGGSSSSGSQSGGGQGQGQGQGSGQSQAQTFNTYLEFGLERGTVYHGISQFNFLPAQIDSPTGLVADAAAPAFCGVAEWSCLESLAAAYKNETLAASNSANLTLPKTTSAIYAGTLESVFADRTHQQHGFYFNFRFDAPMPMRPTTEIVLENKGSWYMPHSDLVLDTRLNDDLKVSLVVPVWQKISLSPTLELFFFQNQVYGNLYRSYSTSLSLNYSFEWHNGLRWKRSLGYANPVPPQPTLPLK
jgi:hypothetical protein